MNVPNLSGRTATSEQRKLFVISLIVHTSSHSASKLENQTGFLLLHNTPTLNSCQYVTPLSLSPHQPLLSTSTLKSHSLHNCSWTCRTRYRGSQWLKVRWRYLWRLGRLVRSYAINSLFDSSGDSFVSWTASLSNKNTEHARFQQPTDPIFIRLQ